MTTAQHAALRALLTDQTGPFTPDSPRVVATLLAHLPSLLDRLDTAERLLGEAAGIIDRLVTTDSDNRIAEVKYHRGDGRSEWIRDAAIEVGRVVSTFLATKEG